MSMLTASISKSLASIGRQMKRTDSDHLARYGYSPTGMVHIWSNHTGYALCGRSINQSLRYSKVIRSKPLCKVCAKSNKRRYGLFDLTPLVFGVSVIAGIAATILKTEHNPEM